VLLGDKDGTMGEHETRRGKREAPSSQPRHPLPLLFSQESKIREVFSASSCYDDPVSYPVDRLMTKKKKEQVFDGTFTAEDQGVFDV
jgi:hypothetical protein